MVTMMTRQMNNASLRHLSDGVFVFVRHLSPWQTDLQAVRQGQRGSQRQKKVSFSAKRQTSRRKSRIEK
ncbi:MAG TPA: hypothetical protein DHU79_07795 [Clostridiales bacterium]|nr:hypothetical protein [Clostridiales bacterium]